MNYYDFILHLHTCVYICVSRRGHGIARLVIYATIATCGYLSFGAETQQDFIRNYPAEDASHIDFCNRMA